ncbi:hypothetical protein SKAU_G00136960 [Synaphobranchus kaupii]|uniref:Protein phosphatase 1 regulatory subunit n=1 Tax=Synaphobranchus kaupii TaxID=118154 RepID=A0A9Q1J417_SYNKA|nr:hypothetical protein SKAU_G00136960 [Synaphobranchus kaupii]
MADAAKAKRREQLKRWARSSTDKQSAVPRIRWKGDERESEEIDQVSVGLAAGPIEGNGKSAMEGDVEPTRSIKRRRHVRFERSAEFLAACACGDTEEANEMLLEVREKDGGQEEEEGDVVNSSNADGITALHQACIDGSMDVVVFLLAHGAHVNQADSEGWTPLHVAASCGNLEITDFLLQQGACLCMVNCDGDVPLDIAEDEATESLLLEHTLRLGLDLDAVKREEQERIMRDARTWLAEGLPSDLRHPKTGATPLHVAAAKGYVEVIKLLCQCGLDVSLTDSDGWTPLHAAAHWGQGEASKILAEHLCNMEARSNAGQTPFDVADENIKSLLEELSRKQAHWRSEQPVSRPVAETTTANTPNKSRRSSVCRMSSRDKTNVQDQSKERGVPGGLQLSEDERESSPEGSKRSSPDSEIVITSASPADQSPEEREREEKERERESRTARIQPTPQRHDAPSTDSSGNSNTDRRIFQAPVRDEESESQRKARSRLMRQSRRSTQGVTLTDLKEAEKCVGKNSDLQRSVYQVSPVIIIMPAERDIGPANFADGDKSSELRVKDQRRGKKDRRSTGVVQISSGENEDSEAIDDMSPDNFSQSSENQLEDDFPSSSPNYKMLYTTVLQENELLREKLQETELLLSQNKVELERLRQSQEKNSERPALLDLERFEKRTLERKATELEDELKVLGDLKAHNQRLKDENGSLVRVISKLSK